MRENLYGVRSGPHERTLLNRIAGEPSGGAEGLDRLLTTVPAVTCRLGPDAYRDGAGAWLRALPLGEGPRAG